LCIDPSVDLLPALRKQHILSIIPHNMKTFIGLALLFAGAAASPQFGGNPYGGGGLEGRP